MLVRTFSTLTKECTGPGEERSKFDRTYMYFKLLMFSMVLREGKRSILGSIGGNEFINELLGKIK